MVFALFEASKEVFISCLFVFFECTPEARATMPVVLFSCSEVFRSIDEFTACCNGMPMLLLRAPLV